MFFLISRRKYIYCDSSLEPSVQDGSNEGPQCTFFFLCRNIENYRKSFPFYQSCLEHRCRERYICVKHTQTLLARFFLTLNSIIAVVKKIIQLL